MPRRDYGPPPTLLQLHRENVWLWLYCNGCKHARPVTLVPYMIRWGLHASSDQLRSSAKCERCGTVGAALRHPSWTGQNAGFETYAEALARDTAAPGDMSTESATPNT